MTKNLFASRIYTMDIVSGAIRELTTESFAQAPTFTPDGRSIVYMTGAGVDTFPFQLRGADWWIMNIDGSDKRRLTFMNVRGNAQSVNRFRLALFHQRHRILRRRDDEVARPRRQDRARRLRLSLASRSRAQRPAPPGEDAVPHPLLRALATPPRC